MAPRHQVPAAFPLEYEWYALVLLGKNPQAAPRTFIMPRDHVAAASWIRHMEWLTDPTAPRGQRNVGPDRSRVEIYVIEAYEDQWDLLERPTSEAPILLPPHFRGWRSASEWVCRQTTHGITNYRSGDRELGTSGLLNQAQDA